MASKISSSSCLVCCEAVETNFILQNSAHILSDLFALFCKFMKLEPQECDTWSCAASSSANVNQHRHPFFDFTKEHFPFCNACKSKLVKLFKLNEQLESIQKQINVVTSCFAAKIIESCDVDAGLNPDQSQSGVKVSRSRGNNGNNYMPENEKTRRKILGLRSQIRSNFHVDVLLNQNKSIAKDLKMKRKSSATDTDSNSTFIGPNLDGSCDENYSDEDLISQSQTSQPTSSTFKKSFRLRIKGASKSSNYLTAAQKKEHHQYSKSNSSNEEIDVTSNDRPANYTITTSEIKSKSQSTINLKVQDDDKDHEPDLLAAGNDSDGPCEMSSGEEYDDNDDEKSKSPGRGVSAQVHRVVEQGPNQFTYAKVFHFERNEQDLFQCKSCFASYDTRKKCVDHIRTKHLYPTRFRCIPCGRTYPQKCNLTAHNKSYHFGDNSFVCPNSSCAQSFKNYSSLYFHKNFHNCGNDYQFECTFSRCKKRFPTTALLEQHKQVHTKPFKCPQCPRRFGYKKGVVAHINMVHSRLKPYLCSSCGMRFAHKTHLNDHIQRKHGSEKEEESACNNIESGEEIRVAETVEVTSTEEINANTHKNQKIKPSMSSSKKSIEFICEQCGKIFKTTYQLKLHQEAHEKTPVCPHCHRTYATVKNLRDHLRLSHGLKMKSYPCDLCDRTFRKSSRLWEHKALSHERKEGQEGLYECQECGLTFPFQYLLERHAIKHTETYKCHVCQLTYTTKKYLKTHLLIHEEHGMKQFPCLKCGKRFIRNIYLTRHMNQEHCEASSGSGSIPTGGRRTGTGTGTETAKIKEKA